MKVSNSCGSVNSATATVGVTPPITTQPADTTVCTGTSATLTIASSEPRITYTWYAGTAGDKTTQLGTGATLTLTNVTATRTVWCEANSAGAWTRSRTATITARNAPTLAYARIDPYDTNCRTLAADVIAADQPNVTYQWYRGSVGDTSTPIGSSTRLATVCPTQTTTYWVRVKYLSSPQCYTDASVTVPVPLP